MTTPYRGRGEGGGGDFLLTNMLLKDVCVQLVSFPDPQCSLGMRLEYNLLMEMSLHVLKL